MPEKRVSFGELFPDRTFYIIRLYPPATGFFANYNYILGYMKYAYNRGWIPIIDMRSYDNLYNQHIPRENMDKRDVWGWFFEQPIDYIHKRRYSLEEVYQSKNVILSCGSEDFYDSSFQDITINWQRKMIERIPFNKKTKDYIMSALKTVYGDENIKIIALPIRGTDLQHHVAGHAKQMGWKDAINYVNYYGNKWYSDNWICFLNSEEQDIVKRIANTLPNVKYLPNERIANYKNENAANANHNIDKQQMLLDYITNVYIMSQCDSLIGTKNNGFYTSLLWSNGRFEHFKLIDMGKYL